VIESKSTCVKVKAIKNGMSTEKGVDIVRINGRKRGHRMSGCDIIPLLGSLAMSSSGLDSGNTRTMSKEGVVARDHAGLFLVAFGMGSVTLISDGHG
jgi:hypothetical protein